MNQNFCKCKDLNAEINPQFTKMDEYLTRIPFRLLVQPNVLWNTRALQESGGWPGHHIRERQGESHTGHGLTTGDVTSHLQVVVHGFMESDSYSPLLNISVIPQVTYRLAPAIWNKLYNYDQNLYGSGSSASSRTGESEAACLALVILVMATTTS